LSAHGFVAGMRKNTGLLVLSICGGLLIALQLLIPSLAFASTSRSASDHAFSSSQQEAFDLADVAVVRLVVTYTVPGSSSRMLCTGLGAIVGSWLPNSPTDKNTWVVTDSSLVTTNGTSCKGPGTFGILTTVEVLANTTYSGLPPLSQPIGQLNCAQSFCRDAATGTLETLDGMASPGGAVLFSFHSDAQHLQPFLTITPNANTDDTSFGIELASASSSWPTTPVAVTDPNTLAHYLVPDAITSPVGHAPGNVSSTATPTATAPIQATPSPAGTYEPGMPLIAPDGSLSGLYVNENTTITATQINVLLSRQPEFSPTAQVRHQSQNPLEGNWHIGISDYYANNFQGAHTALTAIAHANPPVNPDFKAAGNYDQQHVVPALQKNGKSTTGGSGAGNSGSGTILGFPAGQVILVGIIGVVILLALLLILVSLKFGQARGRRKQELAQFEADQAEAQRLAEIEAQRQQKITARLQSPFSTVRCPNCGVQVTTDDSVCPNCHYLLSASDSGLHLRAVPPPPVEPPAQMSPAQVYSGTPAAPSISEMPTLQFPPSNGNANDSDRTQPYDIQQLQGMNLSLAVGARTDRGIKRKHKPNEDNYFALQAPRPTNTQPQEFGLFVVADGMGGHANGQDASRLAIQTIIDFMLPKLASDEPMSEDDFKNLLNEGVQRANQAVHQRNMEERADMGTTMTAALIVGAIAYVANVGDSRTYLYREPEGLIKITHDHSVVASLVDAGIIKPDDIYTHPKRNQIYRSLGEKPFVEVDTFKVPLQVGDKLLLCSDGLWDMVRDPEIQRLMSAPAPDPNKTGKALIQAALDGGGEDNVSVIVIYINEMSSQPTISNVQLIAKPENVTLPELPLPGA